MKPSHFKSTMQIILFAMVFSVTSFSCKKDDHPVSHTYADHFLTTFTSTNPVFDNGVNAPPTSADFPGGGMGTASQMDNAQTRFNSHITFETLQQVPVHLYTHPPFALELSVFKLPSSMVNSMVYDDKGNSVWFKSVGGNAAFTDGSHSIVAFSLRSDVVGGTGKFAGATGNTSLTGQFNLATGNAEFSTTGNIVY